MEFDPRNTDHGFVYLAREVAGDMCVKIGFSRNPLMRLKDTFNPRLIEIGYAYPCFRSSERKLHEMLVSHRIRGEWFLWNPDVKEAVRIEAKYWLRIFGEPLISRLAVYSRDKASDSSWFDGIASTLVRKPKIPDGSCPF